MAFPNPHPAMSPYGGEASSDIPGEHLTGFFPWRQDMHRIRTRLVAGLFAALAALSCGWLLLAELSAQQPDKKVQADQIRPKWNLGDSWIIETSTTPPQARDEERKPEPVKAKW